MAIPPPSSSSSPSSTTMAQKMIEQHPLQRLPSPSRGSSALFHLLGLCSFTGSYWYLNTHPNFITESYGWHWQYLTILGLTLATATFATGLLADITLTPRFFFLKNSLSVCSAPLEVVIVILYWGLRAIDKSLVLPSEDLELEFHADIGFHAAPAILLTLDLLFFSPPWTINILPAMVLSTVLAFGYWALVEHCYSHNGWYPYPIFEMLNTYQRIALFAMAAATMTASTAMLKWMVGQLNGLEEDKKTPANIKGD